MADWSGNWFMVIDRRTWEIITFHGVDDLMSWVHKQPKPAVDEVLYWIGKCEDLEELEDHLEVWRGLSLERRQAWVEDQPVFGRLELLRSS